MSILKVKVIFKCSNLGSLIYLIQFKYGIK
jgi:hypothetical protein